MKTILFQGDSITDAGRSRENDEWYGHGYPMIVAAEIMHDYPGEFKAINRGIGGNRIVDLYARMKSDILNLKPDYLTILIGVNDVWHDFLENPNGVSNEKFLKIYDMLIEEIQSELKDIKIYILEPFVLKGFATEDNWDAFRKGVYLRAESARIIAEKHDLSFIPLQNTFDRLSQTCPPAYWLIDGVHPSAAGHKVIANAVLAAIKRDL
ncbi:MAG: SGNH/GDSL hydrolase family protein [Clostridia bacterium]|nr:SGNH/GDSL hydrolase family protein [Clostridia bacterium]